MLDKLIKGIENLLRHVDNLKNKFNTNVIVAINRYTEDTEKEIEFLNAIKKYNQIPERGSLYFSDNSLAIVDLPAYAVPVIK